MNVVYERPPMFAEIAAAIPAANDFGVIFSWGDVIYNPWRTRIASEVMAHEAVHGERQMLQGVEAWWRNYIANPEFRLVEEILGHQAEYSHVCRTTRDRGKRTLALHNIAVRLASNLYGSLITYMDAKRAITGGKA